MVDGVRRWLQQVTQLLEDCIWCSVSRRWCHGDSGCLAARKHRGWGRLRLLSECQCRLRRQVRLRRFAWSLARARVRNLPVLLLFHLHQQMPGTGNYGLRRLLLLQRRHHRHMATIPIQKATLGQRGGGGRGRWGGRGCPGSGHRWTLDGRSSHGGFRRRSDGFPDSLRSRHSTCVAGRCGMTHRRSHGAWQNGSSWLTTTTTTDLDWVAHLHGHHPSAHQLRLEDALLQLRLLQLLAYVDAERHETARLLAPLRMVTAQTDELATRRTTVVLALARLAVLHDPLHLLTALQPTVGVAALTGVNERLDAALHGKAPRILGALLLAVVACWATVVKTQAQLLHLVLMPILLEAWNTEVKVLQDKSFSICQYECIQAQML